ncbi:MAG: dockerin type I domain-containing protein [Planctomycetota bacterium]
MHTRKNRNTAKNKRSCHERRLLLETLQPRELLASDLTNPSNHLDVNADEHISAYDALLLISELNSPRAIFAEGESQRLFFPDTSGDGALSALDALLVIEELNAEAESVPMIPDSVTRETLARGHKVDLGYDVRLYFDGDFANFDFTSATPGTFTISASDHTGSNLEGFAPQTIPLKGTLRVQLNGSGNQVSMNGISIPNSLIVEMKGHENSLSTNAVNVGDDFLVFGGNGVEHLNLSNSYVHDLMLLEMHGGDDQIEISDSTLNRELHAYLGGGDDRILTEDTTLGRHGHVHAHAGNDQILHQGFSAAHSYHVHGHDGNDLISAVDTNIGHSLFLFGHNGEDTISADNVNVGDDAHIFGGLKDDRIQARNSQVRDYAIAHGEHGNDTGALANFTARHVDVESIEQQASFVVPIDNAIPFINPIANAVVNVGQSIDIAFQVMDDSSNLNIRLAGPGDSAPPAYVSSQMTSATEGIITVAPPIGTALATTTLQLRVDDGEFVAIEEFQVAILGENGETLGNNTNAAQATSSTSLEQTLIAGAESVLIPVTVSSVENGGQDFSFAVSGANGQISLELLDENAMPITAAEFTDVEIAEAQLQDGTWNGRISARAQSAGTYLVKVQRQSAGDIRFKTLGHVCGTPNKGPITATSSRAVYWGCMSNGTPQYFDIPEAFHGGDISIQGSANDTVYPVDFRIDIVPPDSDMLIVGDDGSQASGLAPSLRDIAIPEFNGANGPYRIRISDGNDTSTGQFAGTAIANYFSDSGYYEFQVNASVAAPLIPFSDNPGVSGIRVFSGGLEITGQRIPRDQLGQDIVVTFRFPNAQEFSGTGKLIDASGRDTTLRGPRDTSQGVKYEFSQSQLNAEMLQGKIALQISRVDGTINLFDLFELTS